MTSPNGYFQRGNVCLLYYQLVKLVFLEKYCQIDCNLYLLEQIHNDTVSEKQIKINSTRLCPKFPNFEKKCILDTVAEISNIVFVLYFPLYLANFFTQCSK